MKKIIAAILVLLTAFFATTALASDVLGPSSGSSDVLLATNQSYKDVYTVGDNVTINSNIGGDLNAAGANVNVIGNVQGNALLAGGTVNSSGDVDGSEKVAGGKVNIQGSVGADLAAAAATLDVSGGTIGGDALLAGRSVNLQSAVKGDVHIAGASVVINSAISGNAYVQASQSLQFGPDAQISGSVYYKSPQKASVDAAAKIGSLNYTQTQSSAGYSLLGLLTLALLVKFLGFIAVGLVFMAARKNTSVEIFQQSYQSPWTNMLLGLAILILGPVLIVILFFLIVGYYLALLGIALYLLLLALAVVFAAFNLGHYLLKAGHKGAENYPEWQAVVLGAALWTLLKFIPIVGWIVIALAFLQALGALGKVIRNFLIAKT